jgi:hypothetical protein
LVRARRELRLRERFTMARRVRFPDRADEKKIKLRNLLNPRLKYLHEGDKHRKGQGLV